MKYSIVMSTAKQMHGYTEYAIEQLNRHFAAWLTEDPRSTYSIKWIKNALILKTDSSVLVEKWFSIEQHYVNHMLNAEQTPSAIVCKDSILANAA